MKIIFPRFKTTKFHNQFDGGNKYIDYISKHLTKKRIDVEIVTTRAENQEKASKIVNGVKYTFIDPILKEDRFLKLNTPYKLLFSHNLRKYLEKTDFDILHNTEMFAYFYLRKKKRKPVITQCFGLEPFYGPESLSQRGLKKTYVKQFLQRTWKYCLQKSDKIASEGDFQNEKIEELGVERKKIFNLPIGIDLKKVNKYKKKYKDRRKDLKIKKKDLIILNVNQIDPDKGIDDIINGFAIIKKEVKNAKLIIIGKGILENMMYKLIKFHGLQKDVKHLKNISEKDLYDYYFSSDIFISASVQHDWITGIQEAMACGLPIVSSGQPFLVKNNINGYVVGIKNPKGIKEGILKIYKSKKMKKMGQESIKFVKKYDYEKIAKAAIKEYKKLIKCHKNKK